MLKSNTGKVYDPVFLFMLVAVMLAIGSSFALRAVVTGMGPASAHAAESPPEDTAQSLDIHSLPAPPIPKTLAATNKPSLK